MTISAPGPFRQPSILDRGLTRIGGKSRNFQNPAADSHYTTTIIPITVRVNGPAVGFPGGTSMSARMFPLFFVISLAVLCFAGEVNAESPALTSLSNLGDARTPLTIPYVERLDQHGKFREPDVKQEMDNKYELLPYFENPQWLAPGNWCSTTNP